MRHETPTQGTPAPYTPGEFADLCEDDMGAAHNASLRELAELAGMTTEEFRAFCAEATEELGALVSQDAMGAL